MKKKKKITGRFKVIFEHLENLDIDGLEIKKTAKQVASEVSTYEPTLVELKRLSDLKKQESEGTLFTST